MTQNIRHALRMTWIAQYGHDGFESATQEQQDEFMKALTAPSTLLEGLQFVEVQKAPVDPADPQWPTSRFQTLESEPLTAITPEKRKAL
jgi:hypothetical protein